MAAAEEEKFYIELCKKPIRFEPISKANNIFFDDANKQVFAVRSGGAMGVTVKGPDEKTSISFRMEDRGDVISVKFSPDKRILAIQRSSKSVEFINFKSDMTPDTIEYSQTCKGKSTEMIGFIWTAVNEVAFITNHGLEQYQVFPEKHSLRSQKVINLQINWFVWLAESYILVLSSGTLGNALHPFQFRPGFLNRLPKFEVDLPVTPRPPKLSLLERDVIIANIYGYLYIVVLRHQPNATVGAEIVLYQLQKDSPAKKTDILQLDMSGRFAINVVDNLVMVHHQASKTSLIFDVKMNGDTETAVKMHHSVLPPLPIKPFKLLLPSLNMTAGTEKAEYNCELYSGNWIVFQPDVVIDAKLGCLWYIKLNLEPLVTMLSDKCKLIHFLLCRRDSKKVILSVCKQMLIPGQQVKLPVVSQAYDMLNQVYKAYRDAESQVAAGEISPSVMQSTWKRKVIIEQSDMYTNVFSVFEDCKDIRYKFMVAVLIEYIRSLNHFGIPVQHYLYELIINILVHNNCFYQLHQFLQYHVLSDSKPLACLMLSLESVYAPAHQLALDMLKKTKQEFKRICRPNLTNRLISVNKRLQTANEEIIEVLLSKHQLLPALRFIRSVGIVDSVSARKFLEAAMNTEDKMLFYAVFKFFEERNLRLKGNPRFQSGEHCDQYVKHFESLYGTEALAIVPVHN